MHDEDLADVLGRKPVVLLFATPRSARAGSAGPWSTSPSRCKREFGDRVAFIHQEVYNDNEISKGVRPQMRAYRLPSEPWLFVIDRSGKVSTAIEGAFSVGELQDAVRRVAGGPWSEGRTSAMGDTDLLDMLASETDRRADTIIEGVEKLAGSGANGPKVEALRVEAHGLKGRGDGGRQS